MLFQPTAVLLPHSAVIRPQTGPLLQSSLVYHRLLRASVLRCPRAWDKNHPNLDRNHPKLDRSVRQQRKRRRTPRRSVVLRPRVPRRSPYTRAMIVERRSASSWVSSWARWKSQEDSPPDSRLGNSLGLLDLLGWPCLFLGWPCLFSLVSLFVFSDNWTFCVSSEDRKC